VGDATAARAVVLSASVLPSGRRLLLLAAAAAGTTRAQLAVCRRVIMEDLKSSSAQTICSAN